jgi:hypothetical protein
MENSGFRAVLNTINIAAVTEMWRFLSGGKFEEEKHALMQDSEAVEKWADAAHLLCMTADRSDTIYIHTQVRAVWLAAFATRMLEMGSKIVYYDRVLWEAAGCNDAVSSRSRPTARKLNRASHPTSLSTWSLK